MPSKKDGGQPPAKPKPEELIAEFKTKFEEFSSDTKHSLDQLSEDLGNVKEAQRHLEDQTKIYSIEETQNIDDFTEKLSQQILEKLTNSERDFKHEFLRLEGFLQEGTGSSRTTGSQLDNIAEIVEEMWEKLEMFELKKRSNLIFYGVRGETRETQSELIHKISTIIRRSLDLKKDVTVSNASRVYSGPKVGSCRPVVVTFEELHAREEVLAKAALLKGSNIYITEDFSRTARGTRKELERFMRDVKRLNPGARVVMKYDAVEVGGVSYVYDHQEGRVVHSGYQAEQPSLQEEESDNEGEEAVSFKKDFEEKQNSINELQLCIEGKDQRIIELEETIEELKSKILE